MAADDEPAPEDEPGAPEEPQLVRVRERLEPLPAARREGTHTVIGAYLGAGIVATSSFKEVSWGKLGQIVLSWFISPLFAALISFIMMARELALGALAGLHIS